MSLFCILNGFYVWRWIGFVSQPDIWSLFGPARHLVSFCSQSILGSMTYISYSSDQPFKNRTIGNLNFKTFGILIFCIKAPTAMLFLVISYQSFEWLRRIHCRWCCCCLWMGIRPGWTRRHLWSWGRQSLSRSYFNTLVAFAFSPEIEADIYLKIPIVGICIKKIWIRLTF